MSGYIDKVRGLTWGQAGYTMESWSYTPAREGVLRTFPGQSDFS
jgi:hypothetical protein